MVAHVKAKLDEFKSTFLSASSTRACASTTGRWSPRRQHGGAADAVGRSLDARAEGGGAPRHHPGAVDILKEMSSRRRSTRCSTVEAIDFDCMSRDSGNTSSRAGRDPGLFDDHIVKTQAMRGSPFVALRDPHEGGDQLMSMQEIIDEWLKCQSVWPPRAHLLVGGHHAPDADRGERFTQVDRLWRKAMAATASGPTCCGRRRRGHARGWQESNRLLELIQQGSTTTSRRSGSPSRASSSSPTTSCCRSSRTRTRCACSRA